MMEYKVIVGSRCYGLELERSDTDLFSVNCDSSEHNSHVIDGGLSTDTKLLSMLHFGFWYHPQAVFPAQFLIENELTQYIKTVREDLVSAQKQSMFRVLYDGGEAFAYMLKHWYPLYPKRAAYSTLLYDQIARYATGIPFAEAMCPVGDMRDKLLAMRRKELPVEDVVKINDEAQKKAIAVQDFYNSENDTKKVQEVQRTVAESLKQ